MNKLYDEIMEGKHDKVLGVASLIIYGGVCYTISGIIHKIKNKKERDTAIMRAFFTGYDMSEAIKTSKKDDRKWGIQKVKLRLFLLSRNLHVI